MVRSSKSVGFDEYRDCSWQDAYNEVYDHNEHRRNEMGNKRTNDTSRFLTNNYETGTKFYEFSQLPPPLESRDRLVPCMDPPTAAISIIPNWWNSKIMEGENFKEKIHNSSSTPLMSKREDSIGRINNSYIMPSSMNPAYSSLGALIPPPTAYRDETSSKDNTYHQCISHHFDEDSGHGQVNENQSSVCDIIEIKRPGTVCFHRNESDYGLVYPYETASQYESGSNVVDSNNQFWETASNNCSTSTQHTSRHSRSGIFNLPKIYSPPPLARPISQQTSVLQTDASQMLMPSFFDSTSGTSDGQLTNKQYTFQGCHIKAPRMVYSEPILKSDRENGIFPQNTIRPETTRVSPRVRNKTFFEATTSDCEKKRNGGTMKAQKWSIYCSDRRLVGHEHAQSTNESNFSEADDTRGDRRKHDGSGDYSECSNHNCLSPRARVSRLQPSVITPEVTESLLSDCLANLRSAHWEDNFQALSQIYNLTELHPGRVKNILNKVIWYGFPHLSSPRTKLARMACICFKRLYQTQKRSMETEGEKVFYRLLDLCGGLANNFIQQESREALVSAVENMDPLKSLSFLELHGAKHKNPHVREFSAYLLSAIMDELPQNKLMNKEFSPRVIPMIVSFLREGLLQTRLHAKLALDKIFDHPTFESKLRRYVSPENVRHIADTLREFRERRSGHVH